MAKDYELSDVLNWLYSHEINFGMQSFFDGGYNAWIGDKINGIADNEIMLNTPDEVAAWIVKTVERLYPATKYIKPISSYNR